MPGPSTLSSGGAGHAMERPSAHVLVVDDEARNVRLMQLVLRAEGYTISTAGSGQESLTILATRRVDLIVLDVMMPGMSGFDVCRDVRTDPATHFVPVILVTALADLGDRVQGIEAGADDFISKPFNEVELRARVRSLLRIKALHDQLEQRNNLLLDALQ